MPCPFCHHAISYREFLKILNPFKFKCSACGATLTLKRQGTWFASIGAMLGGGAAAVAIYLEQAQGWPKLEALGAFAGVFVPLVGVAEWAFWRKATPIMTEPPKVAQAD